MRKIITCLFFIGAFALQSCQKETSIDTVQQPPDTTQETGGSDTSFLPHSITAISADADERSITVAFKYLLNQHQIQVYLDDTTTADPYDQLALTYFYNNDGYFTKREDYDAAGNVSSAFIADRGPDNTLRTVIAWAKDTVLGETFKDTFAVSFADSASYKIMMVNNTVRFQSDAVTVNNRITLQNNRVLKERGGNFTGGGANIGIPGLTFTYDASDRLSLATSDGYYGTAYTYENTGRSLDSFFQVIGGKDGYLLDVDGLWSSTAQAEFNFFPLFVILANRNVELYAEMHRYGVLKEVRSIPNGADFPYTEMFDFQNTFDDKQRITETEITNNGSLYATWKIKY